VRLHLPDHLQYCKAGNHVEDEVEELSVVTAVRWTAEDPDVGMIGSAAGKESKRRRTAEEIVYHCRITLVSILANLATTIAMKGRFDNTWNIPDLASEATAQQFTAVPTRKRKLVQQQDSTLAAPTKKRGKDDIQVV
jgi:hypothetical protein